MEKLTYFAEINKKNDKINLVYSPDIILEDEEWEDFSRYIMVYEKDVRGFSAEELRYRWENHHAAIAVSEHNEIISYSSVLPAYDTKIKKAISQNTDIKINLLPNFTIYESATGVTKQDWRRKGINIKLLENMVEFHKNESSTFLMICFGFAASPLVEKLGWKLSAWRENQYVTSLLAWAEEEKIYKTNYGFLPHKDKHLYDGKHLTPEDFPYHNWKNFLHLWIEDLSIVNKLNNELYKVFSGNLEKWKNVLRQVVKKI